MGGAEGEGAHLHGVDLHGGVAFLAPVHLALLRQSFPGAHPVLGGHTLIFLHPIEEFPSADRFDGYVLHN